MDGVASELPAYLGLEVENFGSVPFPLIESVATNLIKYCRQETFEENTPTKVDKNWYQLEPSKVKITHPDWNAKLSELVKQVSKGLGCYGEVEVFVFLYFKILLKDFLIFYTKIKGKAVQSIDLSKGWSLFEASRHRER